MGASGSRSTWRAQDGSVRNARGEVTRWALRGYAGRAGTSRPSAQPAECSSGCGRARPERHTVAADLRLGRAARMPCR